MRLGQKHLHYDGRTVDPNQLTSNRSRLTTTTYWAGNQGQIYIGPYLIDEVVGFGYKLNQSKIPVYGYNSQYFDAVADGKVLISGWLTINYIDSGYLYAAINKYVSDVVARNVDDDASPTTLDTMLPMTTFPQSDVKKILEELRNNENDPAVGNPWGTPNISLMKKVGQALNENSSMKNEMIRLLKNRFWGLDSQDPDGLGSNQKIDQIKSASIQHRKGTAYTDSFDYLSIFRPDQMPQISMTIAHGDPLDYNSSTFRVMSGIHILSCEQNIHITDDPQTETYTFIARTINY